MLIGAMLLIVPILSFQGSEVKTAEGQSECTRVEVSVNLLRVYDDEDIPLLFLMPGRWNYGHMMIML
jgi:hypothetical protein